MRCKYSGKDEGPTLSVCMREDKMSMDIKSNVGIPTEAWSNNGWKLTPLVSATVSDAFFLCCIIFRVLFHQLDKKLVDKYQPGKLIPHFLIEIQLEDFSNPRSLSQKVGFLGVEEEKFIIISRQTQLGLFMSKLSVWFVIIGQGIIYILRFRHTKQCCCYIALSVHVS